MKTHKIAAFAAGALFASALAASAQDCVHSKYGADDEIGAANMITPESVLEASKLIKKGERHPLGIVIEPGMPAYPPRSVSLQVVQPGQGRGRIVPDSGWPVSSNDDLAQLWFGTGPQIDGLGHLGESDVYYNCNEGVDFAQVTGLTKLGTHNIPPLVARAVLIDMVKHLGAEKLGAGNGITAEDLKAAAAEQGVEIRKGDVILFHTGWTDSKLKDDPQAWVSGEPGLTNEAAAYLASLEPVAVGSDTWGLEAVPPVEGDKIFYGHNIFLAKNGIYILETMDTGPLAEQGVNEFMFVLGQARVKGAVQMMINPVALW